MTFAPAVEAALASDLERFRHDPLGYVRFAFRWNKGELVGQSGPRTWQVEVLEEVGQRLRNGQADAFAPIQEAVASGHGIGKSALVSWIVLWALSTLADTRVVVTANTAPQLETKTWPELAKWHRLAINKHWFEYSATALSSADPDHAKTWRADALPWSKERSEAFAGLHNAGRRIVLIFDEASAIDSVIWDVAEGALTDANTEILWLAFGNPTRNSGRFFECFGRLAHRWTHRQIDSRTVEGANLAQMAKWVEDYGEDSDFVRVRVRGVFPRAGSQQFIPSDIVAAAAVIDSHADPSDPVVMGIDVARSITGDESCIRVRRGRDCRLIPPIYLQTQDTMTIVGRAIAEIGRLERLGWEVDMVFVDVTGVGAGVTDRLRQLLGPMRVMGVNNGAASDSPSFGGDACANKGAECWAKMREALRTGLAIDNDADLHAQLTSREYGYNANNAIVLERKDDMKKRGLSSPDRADAIALTYAYPIPSRDKLRAPIRQAVGVDYHPYGRES